ncbi:helix-turn-helix domain-containing protein [Corynebacterium glyciniphilum]|uniref:helix-turn-helix domain-containing protein n=1 Tax=Corynebacterium glyciniphilum TaxID=1404244 RepID=UPI00264E8C72|nr:helix-turn-helix domain-containing protein [Corynebacterium glyciniphilum]MDN6705119.1 helix-turn-helix domain-containing protein [Corynebacterium glyciniphilum]
MMYNLEETAATLGVSTRTVDRWRKNGTLNEPERHGKRLYWPRDYVEQLSPHTQG